MAQPVRERSEDVCIGVQDETQLFDLPALYEDGVSNLVYTPSVAAESWKNIRNGDDLEHASSLSTTVLTSSTDPIGHEEEPTLELFQDFGNSAFSRTDSQARSLSHRYGSPKQFILNSYQRQPTRRSSFAIGVAFCVWQWHRLPGLKDRSTTCSCRWPLLG